MEKMTDLSAKSRQMSKHPQQKNSAFIPKGQMLIEKTIVI